MDVGSLIPNRETATEIEAGGRLRVRLATGSKVTGSKDFFFFFFFWDLMCQEAAKSIIWTS